MAPALTLFFIIFLEGYIVLSTEILAIRQLIPFVGSGTDTISIIIAAVLMPLAFGYYAGGQFRPIKYIKGHIYALSLRERLLRNIMIAAIILTIGLSYPSLTLFFDILVKDFGINNRLIMSSVYALVFLVYPVFLLGQTIPLISHYFSKQKLPSLTGKILFFSTIGSFTGALFCTLVLMTFLGVHHAVSFTIACLFILSLILIKKPVSRYGIATGLALVVALIMNSEAVLPLFNIVSNNAHNLVQIQTIDSKKIRILSLNHNASSVIFGERPPESSYYIHYVEDNFITPAKDGEKLSILVIGAGGFAVGRDDKINDYVFVDIDPELKEIAEKHFLKEALSPNKKFVAKPVRAYLNQLARQTDQTFDLVFIDLFRGPSGTPEHLITREFFQQIRKVLNPDGVAIINTIMTSNFADPLSIRLDNTIRSVFHLVSRQIMGGHNGLAHELGTIQNWSNILYIVFNNDKDDQQIYTDNKNSSLFDNRNVITTKH